MVSDSSFNSDEYLHPTLSDDPLLQVDIDIDCEDIATTVSDTDDDTNATLLQKYAIFIVLSSLIVCYLKTQRNRTPVVTIKICFRNSNE